MTDSIENIVDHGEEPSSDDTGAVACVKFGIEVM